MEQEEEKFRAKLLKQGDKEVSDDNQSLLEVDIHRSLAHDESPAGRGTEGNGIKRLTSDSTLVKH